MESSGTAKKTKLTDEVMFININSSPKSFMNKFANVITQPGMSESFVEIVLK
ncbi:MAG: hypothetical protein RBR74_10470 [Ignavibacteriaceae bacterium]|nr:hypothetical protein [Ignavibacteriaceae bacterium]